MQSVVRLYSDTERMLEVFRTKILHGVILPRPASQSADEASCHVTKVFSLLMCMYLLFSLRIIARSTCGTYHKRLIIQDIGYGAHMTC